MPARGSLRSRSAAAVSGLTLRQLSAVLPPERTWGLWTSRRIVARIMDSFGPSLAGTEVEKVDVRLRGGGRVVGEWVRGGAGGQERSDRGIGGASGQERSDRGIGGVGGQERSDRGIGGASGQERSDRGIGGAGQCIYFVHGSGFALCSPRTHRRLTAWLSRLTGLPVFCVDYRLAPRYRFPTAAVDVRTGWDWLRTEKGYDPADIVIVGDSAGGHLAVDLLLQPDVAHPAGLAVFSPLIDLTFGLARTREELRRDPAIRASDAQRLVELYCAGTDVSHPRLTLDVAGGRRLPPTLVQAGGGEMLVGDARKLAADIAAAGGTVELQVWPDQVHVFQALPRLTPEAAPAMRQVAAFVAESLRDNGIQAAG
ncbi:alpha/beta hydrolase [Mycolicibacterium madagascariense]|nr:alpha/beta hydrolase [Mycolicibacterium madagascariense]MCV7013531.1 alpha/beta hydrolase [Mycolicibacterium madagascariense]